MSLTTKLDTFHPSAGSIVRSSTEGDFCQLMVVMLFHKQEPSHGAGAFMQVPESQRLPAFVVVGVCTLHPHRHRLCLPHSFS